MWRLELTQIKKSRQFKEVKRQTHQQFNNQDPLLSDQDPKQQKLKFTAQLNESPLPTQQ